MYIMYHFTTKTSHGKSLWTKKNVLSLIFFPLTKSLRKQFRMVASEHTGVLEGRQRLIVMVVPDSEEAADNGYIDIYCANFMKRIKVVQEGRV